MELNTLTEFPNELTGETLRDRMKKYEFIKAEYLNRNCFPEKQPLIIRIDGKAFHTLTRNFKKPYDEIFGQAMIKTAEYLCENISNCKIAYTQSDEISLLLVDYEKERTHAWFKGSIQKICSVSASMATLAFNKAFLELLSKASDSGLMENETIYKEVLFTALFDSRAFVIDKEEVANYFIYRQKDAMRNFIQSYSRTFMSQKDVNFKSCAELMDIIFLKTNKKTEDIPNFQLRGVCINREEYLKEDVTRHKWVADLDIPLFTENREYIERYVFF